MESDLNKDPTSLYEGIDYKQFWSGQKRQNLDDLEHAIVRKILPPAGFRIIDVGCGFGRLADCYIDRYQQVVMVDGSISLLKQAIETTEGRAIYIASDVSRLPFRQASFDAVLMIRVFHHIPDSRALLSDITRILCNDGNLIFNFCNKQNWRRIFRWLIGTNTDNPFSTIPDGFGSTMISHHPNAIERLLQECRFLEMQYYGLGIVDKFGIGRDSCKRWITIAEHLAPFFAMARVAPWILCHTKASNANDLITAREIGNILICPLCRSQLNYDKYGYICLSCGRKFPIDDGIIDLRI